MRIRIIFTYGLPIRIFEIDSFFRQMGGITWAVSLGLYFCNINQERIDHKNKSQLASRIMVNTCFESSWLHFITSYSPYYSVLDLKVFQKRWKKLSQGRRLFRRFYDSGSHTDDIVICLLFGECCRLYFFFLSEVSAILLRNYTYFSYIKLEYLKEYLEEWYKNLKFS